MKKALPILTPKQRQQRNHDEMVAAILQVSRDIMREQGVADLNLQEIARRVGMRAPSLYNYFSGKSAIYEALFVSGMRMYREQLETLFEQHGATWNGLTKIMEGYLAFALENPELYQLLFERPVPGFTPSAEGLEEANKLLEFSRHITREAVAAGTFQSVVSTEATMNLIIALMHGFTALHLANEPHLPSGSGRFGSLIPVIVEVLQKAWSHPTNPE